jgi:polyhydroxyalkanoate synthesis regulator phasin
MTYTPKKSIEEEQQELDIKVSRRIDEILSSIKQVGSMYVEPNDIILVQVDDNTTDQMVTNLQKMLSKVFKDNKGLFVPNNIQFKVIKKEESDTWPRDEIEELKRELDDLRKQVQNLENLINASHNETKKSF